MKVWQNGLDGCNLSTVFLPAKPEFPLKCFWLKKTV